MDALEFINKDLKIGDKVVVTIGGYKNLSGYFGGYKTFDSSNNPLNYALYPVFYAAGKDGQMVKRSLIPGRLPWWGFSDIVSVEKVTTKWRHVAYINNWSDCYDANLRGAKAVLREYGKFKKDGVSNYAFHDPDNGEVFEDVQDGFQATVLEKGRYAVSFQVSGDYPTDEKVLTEGNCPWYVDIFERIDEEAA